MAAARQRTQRTRTKKGSRTPKGSAPYKSRTTTREGIRFRGKCYLSSGMVARIAGVDLKTIHNWAKAGLAAHHTGGRHLRLTRAAVALFLRDKGASIPARLAKPRARIVTHSQPPTPKWLSALRRECELHATPTLTGAVVAAATGDFEILLLDLDRHDIEHLQDVMETIQAHPVISAMVVIGVSTVKWKREWFLLHGGLIVWTPGGPAGIRRVVRWAIGAEESLPPTATTRTP